MRPIARFAALALFAAGLTSVHAADISEEGAKDIETRLSRYLPRELVDAGLIEIAPSKDRYTFIIDPQPLIGRLQRTDLLIKGVKPFLHSLIPRDDGLWGIAANQAFRMQVVAGTTPRSNVIDYRIDNIIADGLFDPSISFFKELKTSATGTTVTTDSSTEKSRLTIAAMGQLLQSTKIDDAHATIAGNIALSGLNQSVKLANAGEYGFTIGSAVSDVRVKNFGIAAFRDLMVFALARLDRHEKLTPAEAGRLKTLLRANLYFADSVEEAVTLKDVTTWEKGKEISLGELVYKFDFNGVSQNTTFGFQLSVANPQVPPGIMPPGAEVMLPKTVSFGFALTDVNLAGAAHYFLDQADLTSDNLLTRTEGRRLGRTVLRDHRIPIEFRNVSAKSDYYDLEMTGSMLAYVYNEREGSADVTLYARDLDKTIAYLQSRSNSVPMFRRLSFVVMAMKGFAKQAPDGRAMWRFILTEDGKATMNGQPVPMPQ